VIADLPTAPTWRGVASQLMMNTTRIVGPAPGVLIAADSVGRRALCCVMAALFAVSSSLP
jgi:hypothetical protein